MFGFEPKNNADLSAGPSAQQEARIRQLEAQCLQLQHNLVQVLNLLQVHITQTQANEAHLHKDFESLAKYVVSPRRMLGENQEMN